MDRKMFNDITKVLDKAWEMFGIVTPENDYDFEEYISEELIDIDGVRGVLWYASSPNCHIILHTEDNRFYDIDYVSYEIKEIKEEEAILIAKSINEDMYKELLGID